AVRVGRARRSTHGVAGLRRRGNHERPAPHAIVKLVLFDIDGTILLTDGAGKRAIHRALREVFGGTGPDDHAFGGKTDPQIVRDLMKLEGHGDEHIDTHMERLLELYVTYLHDELRANPSGITVMPGVCQLLDALDARDDVVVGLLTGNLAAGARAKLEAARIDPSRFRGGAYRSGQAPAGGLPAGRAATARRARARGVCGGGPAGSLRP